MSHWKSFLQSKIRVSGHISKDKGMTNKKPVLFICLFSLNKFLSKFKYLLIYLKDPLK